MPIHGRSTFDSTAGARDVEPSTLRVKEVGQWGNQFLYLFAMQLLLALASGPPAIPEEWTQGTEFLLQAPSPRTVVWAQRGNPKVLVPDQPLTLLGLLLP